MNPQNKKKRPLHSYAWYSSIAVQMLVIILVCVVAGVKIDSWLHTRIPVFTILFSLLGVAVAIYQVTHDLIKRHKS